MLAHIWFGFFVAAFIGALYQWLVQDQGAVFSALMQSTFDMAALSVEISIGLIGVLCLPDTLARARTPVPEADARCAARPCGPWQHDHEHCRQHAGAR
jgi:hypothetical protein